MSFVLDFEIISGVLSVLSCVIWLWWLFAILDQMGVVFGMFVPKN